MKRVLLVLPALCVLAATSVEAGQSRGLSSARDPVFGPHQDRLDQLQLRRLDRRFERRRIAGMGDGGDRRRLLLGAGDEPIELLVGARRGAEIDVRHL